MCLHQCAYHAVRTPCSIHLPLRFWVLAVDHIARLVCLNEALTSSGSLDLHHAICLLQGHALILLIVLGAPEDQINSAALAVKVGSAETCVLGTVKFMQSLPEQHNVRLWFVNGIVYPASGLLHTNPSPFALLVSRQFSTQSASGNFYTENLPLPIGAPWAKEQQCRSGGLHACDQPDVC